MTLSPPSSRPLHASRFSWGGGPAQPEASLRILVHEAVADVLLRAWNDDAVRQDRRADLSFRAVCRRLGFLTHVVAEITPAPLALRDRPNPRALEVTARYRAAGVAFSVDRMHGATTKTDLSA